MKRIDFRARQDRLIYILLVVAAAVGLSWVVWRHQYLAAHDKPAPAVVPAAAR